MRERERIEWWKQSDNENQSGNDLKLCRERADIEFQVNLSFIFLRRGRIKGWETRVV